MTKTACSRPHLAARMVPLLAIALAFAGLSLLAISCTDIWGAWDNPVDPTGTSYQGFDTIKDPDAIQPVDIDAGVVTYVPVFKAEKVVGATAYQFQVAEESTFTQVLWTSPETESNEFFPVGLTGLSATTTYYWRVRAIVNGNPGEWSTSIATFSLSAAETDTMSPVNQSVITDTTPAFDWSDVTGATGYRIQLADNDSFANPVTDNATLTASAYTQTTPLANNSTWWWRVAVRNADGVWSAWTAGRSFTIGWNPAISPSWPGNTTVVSDTTPLLEWSDATGAVSYELQLASSSAELAAASILTASTSQYQIGTPYADGATVFWQVRPKNADNVYGAWQGPWSFTVTLERPTLTSPASAATITDTTPAFDWSDVTGASGYRIQIADNDSFASPVTDDASLTASAYTQSTPLANNSTWWWRVAVRNADGVWSAWTAARSFTLSWNPVITPSWPGNAAVISDSSPLLDWGDATGADSYELQQANSTAGLASATILTASTSQYQIGTPYADGATVFWQVRPKNADNVYGAWQGTWSFTVSLERPTLTSPASAATITDTTPDFNWSDVAGATGYRIQIAATESFASPVTDDATLTASAYTQATALDNETDYYWRVMVKNADGIWSAWTSVWSFTVSITATLDIQEDLNNPLEISMGPIPSVLYDGQSFSASATVTPTPDSYTWYLDGKKIANVTTSTITIIGDLITVGVHRLAIKAMKGSSGAVAEGTFEKRDGLSPPPSMVMPVDGSSVAGTRPTFTWEAVDGAASYELVLASSEAGLEGATPMTVSGTSWTPTSDLALGAWYWRVRSLDYSATPGNWSTARSFSCSLLTMISVPAGSFHNGTSTVTLSAYTMAVTEITQGQYQTVMGSNPSSISYGIGATNPVNMVSWYDALVFCNKLSILEARTPVYSIGGSPDPAAWGTVPTSSDNTWNAATMNMAAKGYRLPTEAEWEYAARGGTPVDSYTYAGSNTIGDVAWYSDNSGYVTQPVAGKMPNKLGFYDMSGSVWERCWDWYGSYPAGAQTDPSGTASGDSRVERGGGFDYGASYCTVSKRISSYPYSRLRDGGFRVVARP